MVVRCRTLLLLLLLVIVPVLAGAQVQPGYEIRVTALTSRKATIEVVESGTVRSRVVATLFQASRSLEVKSTTTTSGLKRFVRTEDEVREQVEETIFRDLGKSGTDEKVVAADVSARLVAHFWNKQATYQPPAQGPAPAGQNSGANSSPVYRPVFIQRASVGTARNTAGNERNPTPPNQGTGRPTGSGSPSTPPSLPLMPPSGSPPPEMGPTTPPTPAPEAPKADKWEVYWLEHKQTGKNQTLAGTPAPGATTMEFLIRLKRGDLRAEGLLRLTYRNARFGPESQIWTESPRVRQVATPQAPGFYSNPQNPRCLCPMRGVKPPADELKDAVRIALWKAYDPPIESLDRWANAVMGPRTLIELGLAVPRFSRQ